MFLHFKEPLRSLRRIGIRTWYLYRDPTIQSLHRSKLSINLMKSHRSHTAASALHPKDNIPSQILHDPQLYTPKTQQGSLSIEDYERLMREQGQQSQKVVQLFQEAKSAHLQPSQSMYLSTIKAYAQLVNPKEASLCLAALFERANDHQKIVQGLKAAEELHQVTFIHDWDPHAVSAITDALWNSLVQLLKMPSTPLTALSLERLVAQYTSRPSKKSRLAQYTLLFELASLRCTPTVETCNLILEAQSRVEDFKSMKTVMALMQKLDIDPNLDTVSVLLRTFGSSLPMKEAEKLYDSLKYDSSVCKAFIKVFASNSASATQSQNVILDMKKKSMDLDARSFIDMAEGFVKRNEFDVGLQWLQESKCKDLDSYAVLMEGLLNRGEWDKCLSYYDYLVSEFRRNNVDMNRRIVKCMLAAQFSQNKMDICDDYLASKLKFRFTSNTIIRILNTMMNITDEQGRALVPGHTIVKSLKVLESRLHVYLDAEGISRVIRRLGERGECLEGYRLYNWVRQHGHEASRERCGHEKIYLALISSATDNNNPRVLERAWVDMQYRKQFFGKCVKTAHNLNSYNLLLNGYASLLPRPDLTRVKRTFKRMLKQQLLPNSVTYNILIKAFVNADNMIGANQIYRKMMHESHIQPDAHTTNTLLHGWIVKKEWKQVEDFIEDLRHQNTENLDIVTFNLLLQSFLRLDSASMPRALSEYVTAKEEKLSSETIWNIFESSTGYSKSLLETPPCSQLVIDKVEPEYLVKKISSLKTEPASQNQNAFIKLFSKSTEPNHITYKLFMKAFSSIGDQESASKVYRWMKQHPPL